MPMFLDDPRADDLYPSLGSFARPRKIVCLYSGGQLPSRELETVRGRHAAVFLPPPHDGPASLLADYWAAHRGLAAVLLGDRWEPPEPGTFSVREGAEEAKRTFWRRLDAWGRGEDDAKATVDELTARATMVAAVRGMGASRLFGTPNYWLHLALSWWPGGRARETVLVGVPHADDLRVLVCCDAEAVLLPVPPPYDRGGPFVRLPYWAPAGVRWAGCLDWLVPRERLRIPGVPVLEGEDLRRLAGVPEAGRGA